MDYRQAKAFVEGFTRSGAPVHDLSRIAGLMEKLGNPQDRLKFIHIAGTNGKGSVAEYLTNIFMEAGYRVGTFTSPFIRHYRDRIRLNGEDIPESALCEVCAKVMPLAAPDAGYSQFEITFAMAMLYFLREKADIVVLETGMGGLLDCTNVIQNPEACVLTTIALDHMAVLGDTLEEITAQKAGIIKPGAKVIVSPKNEPGTISAVMDRAAECGCKGWLPLMDEESYELLECSLTGTRFRYFGQEFHTIMGGAHQIANALTAIETVYAMTSPDSADTARDTIWNIPGLAVERGIAKTSIPGRMQILSKYPPVILDGGHNRDGIDALCKTLEADKRAPVIGIIGMTHADAADYAAERLSKVFDSVLCVDGFAPNAMPAGELDALFDKAIGAEHSQSVALSDAMKIAKAKAHQTNGIIVVCGSLFLVSWFLHRED